MRLYTFGNMYLSSIQQGIQTAHVTAELFIKYDDTHDDTEQQLVLHEWAHDYKTMILLNGGYGKNLHELYSFFRRSDNRYPFEKFHEERDALDGAITCVGIVLPERIYALASAVKSRMLTIDDLRAATKLKSADTFTTYQMDLVVKLDAVQAASTSEDFNVQHAINLLNDFDIELIAKLITFNLAS